MTAPSDDLVKRQPETAREIDYEEAHEIAKRFIDFFFGNPGEEPRVCIPARPEYDDDICLHSFIAQQRIALTRLRAELTEAKRRVADAELCAEEQRAYSCELEGDVEQARALLKVATCGRAGSLEFLQFEAARMAWLRLIDGEQAKEERHDR